MPVRVRQPGFLLITVTTAGAPDSLRVHVWRRLRLLGALYLQQSVCLLPRRPEIQRDVERLLARVSASGGASRCLVVTVDDPAQLAQLISEFNQARDGEYTELAEQAPSLLAEIDRELALGRATYTEVEECEANLERFERWLARIGARDYFAAPAGETARRTVQRCRDALASFEAAALHADTATTQDHPGSRGSAPGE